MRVVHKGRRPSSAWEQLGSPVLRVAVACIVRDAIATLVCKTVAAAVRCPLRLLSWTVGAVHIHVGMFNTAPRR